MSAELGQDGTNINYAGTPFMVSNLLKSSQKVMNLITMCHEGNAIFKLVEVGADMNTKETLEEVF